MKPATAIEYSKPLPYSGRRLATVPLMLLPGFMAEKNYEPIGYEYVERFFDHVLGVRVIAPESDSPP